MNPETRNILKQRYISCAALGYALPAEEMENGYSKDYLLSDPELHKKYDELTDYWAVMIEYNSVKMTEITDRNNKLKKELEEARQRLAKTNDAIFEVKRQVDAARKNLKFVQNDRKKKQEAYKVEQKEEKEARWIEKILKNHDEVSEIHSYERDCSEKELEDLQETENNLDVCIRDVEVRLHDSESEFAAKPQPKWMEINAALRVLDCVNSSYTNRLYQCVQRHREDFERRTNGSVTEMEKAYGVSSTTYY